MPAAFTPPLDHIGLLAPRPVPNSPTAWVVVPCRSTAFITTAVQPPFSTGQTMDRVPLSEACRAQMQTEVGGVARVNENPAR